MENIDEQLKINICSILPSISEETVNGIIHAVKYVGLETMSDLRFVQEEDLILVLKPIQRRKLIKAWQEQSISPVKSSTLPLKQCKWKRVNCRHLLRVYTKYKTELSCSSVEEKQEVWRKIAEEVHKKCSLKCNELQCMDKIKELKRQYHMLKHSDKSVLSPKNTVFFNLAKDAFENSVILSVNVSSSVSVQNFQWKKEQCFSLLQICAKYKTEFLSPDVEEQTVWKKIADEVQKLYVNLNCDELQCRIKIEELKGEYERIKNKDVNDQETAVFLDAARKFFETPENPAISPVSASNSLPINCKFEMKRIIKLLRRYVKYRPELSYPGVEKQTVWKKIALKSDESQCGNEIDELRYEYARIKNDNVTNRETAIFLDEAKKAFETTETTEQSSRKYSISLKRSNKEFVRKLLQVYAKYKPELTSPDTKEQKVWEKIAREVTEISSYSCGARICCFELFQLKCQYENFKRRSVSSEYIPLLFDDAREAFEGSEKLDRDFTIKVSNLSKNVEDSDLQELFQHFGRIAHIYAVKGTSGQSKDFAFIKFYKQEDATRAIRIVNGHEYDKFILKVEWAEPSQINEVLE